MPDLKLAKLPDRTPVKITVAVKPDLHMALQNYAVLYQQTYGEAEPITELIPYMLERFLDSDRSFSRAVKEGEVRGAVIEGEASQLRRGRCRNAPPQTTEAAS